jgi:hypothetical protein
MAKYRRALRTFDLSGLTGSPQNVGASIDFAVTQASITNPSTVEILISDGSAEDDIRVPAGATINISRQPGENANSARDLFDAGSQLQVTQVTAAGTGTLVINAMG